MKYSNELKVGMAIVAAVVVFVLGVRYFQDVPLFRGTYDLNSSFESAGGLIAGNPVRVSGVGVGKVREVKLNPEAGLSREDPDLDIVVLGLVARAGHRRRR